MSCENINECSCPKTECPRYKKCCECVKSHKERGYLPHCLRPAEKPAMDFFKAIESRHSYRGAYVDTDIPESDLIKILDAGIRAPSGCNAQTTSFVLVTNPELRAKISEVLVSKAVRTAPALIIVATEKVKFDFGLDFELEDYGAAVENILLAATALGYASCWFDGMTRLNGVCDAIAKILDVPPEKQVRCVLPVGVPLEQGTQAGRKPFVDRVDWRK